MKLMLRSLKGYRLLAAFSLLLLLVQAVCDLMLPAYTSELIDTGIQKNGIEYAVPLKATQEDAAEWSLFLTAEEKQLFDEQYEVMDNNKDEGGEHPPFLFFVWKIC